MGKRVKLKDRLSKALHQKAIRSAHAPVHRQDNKAVATQQHDPAQMTIRHAWSDGQETELPYRTSVDQFILVIGDGDLSFSVAVNKALGPDAKIIASTLDSRPDLERKYGAQVIAGNIQCLEEAGVTVLHGIDGTKLHTRKDLAKHAYSRIVFNYPHTGAGIKDRDRNIRAQQEMLRGFFGSAVKLLKRVNGRCLTRHAISRSKTAPLNSGSKKHRGDDSEDEYDDIPDDSLSQEPEIHVTLRTGDPYDDWKVKGLALSTGALTSGESYKFEPHKLPGYRHVKTLGENEDPPGEDFLAKLAKTFVFRLKK